MPAALGRRLYAGLAAGSAGVHTALLGHAGGVAAAVVLATMIAGCLWCAWHLWQRDTLTAWLTVALMSLAMLAVHTPMPAHHHAPAAAGDVPVLIAVAMAVAAVEVIVAGMVLYVRTRHRGALLTGTPGR